MRVPVWAGRRHEQIGGSMANFAIMRCKKLSTMGSVAASLQHNYRERLTLNADEQQTRHNQHYAAQNTDEAMGRLRENLPEKVRANGVRCVEYMMTASPEWWESASESERKQFFDSSVDWLKQKYGEKNIVAATVHRDETSPHLSAFVTPITGDGRLCARDFIGGREKLSDDQTSYAEKLKNSGLKLERGIKNSKAKHVSIRQYYNAVHKGVGYSKTIWEEAKKIDATPKIKNKSLFKTTLESPNEVSERIRKELQPIFYLASQVMQQNTFMDINERRQKELVRTSESFDLDRKKRHELFSNMSLGQIEKIEQTIAGIQKYNMELNKQFNDPYSKDYSQKHQRIKTDFPVKDPESIGKIVGKISMFTNRVQWVAHRNDMVKKIRKEQKLKLGKGKGFGF